eukprot:gene887-1210_t
MLPEAVQALIKRLRRLGLEPVRKERGLFAHPKHAVNDPYAWHQLVDVVRHIQSFLDTREVLSCDLVCRAWRDARAALQTEVLLSYNHSKRVQKAQQAFLAHNADRLQAVTLQLEDNHSSRRPGTDTSSKSRHGSQKRQTKHGSRLAALACQVTTARSLQLSSSYKLRQLPDTLGKLQQLQVLTINWCVNLMALPFSIGDLSQLQQLTIRCCKSLTALPDTLCELTALQQLQVLGCDSLEAVPALPANLLRLCLVDCPRLQLVGEPGPGVGTASDAASAATSISNLVQLQYLRIEKCGLRQLPEFGVDMVACKSISICMCPNLNELPASICSLPALQQLSLSLRLQSLPANLGQMSQLKHLRIWQGSKESGSSLPASVGQLLELEELEISDWPGLQQLPLTLGNLAALKVLKLQSCSGLSTLPRSIGQLSNLEHLGVSSCNQLVSLPESLGELPCLKSLTVVDCEDLRALPRTLGDLISLQQLTISCCSRLKSLPESLGRLASGRDGHLQRVTINGCDSLQLPISLEPLKESITPGCMAGAVTARVIAAWRGDEGL